ncbi:uncharacterized protein LOC126678782 [Mercurialis annua]|uniref:uncharacterized protein LOC126678782 n=1 Tax=Mercurialis annua TaxID=3986 RepID=UPI00215FA07A|nr:uncharacterized protein LOC126678782 [Mercurialis annua]
MSLFLVFLLICFSSHACNARYLGFTHKDTKQYFSKDVEKGISLHDTSISSEMSSPISEEFGVPKREKIGLGATTMKQNNYKHGGHVLEEEDISNESGNELVISSQKELQQKDEIEGMKKQDRSMVESTESDNEEAVKSNENDIAEDVVVMDYAQPHRKPPIHNEKS